MLFNYNNLETLVLGLNYAGIIYGDGYTIIWICKKTTELYNLIKYIVCVNYIVIKLLWN